MKSETTPVLHTNIKVICLKNITSSEGIFKKMVIVFVKAIQSIRLHNFVKLTINFIFMLYNTGVIGIAGLFS